MSMSAIEICNLALMKFGNLSISSITAPTNKEERSCAVFYPILRDQLVYSYPWNFAMSRADISSQVATAPAFGPTYSYTLPTDCLRVWEFYGSDAEWLVESGQFLTDESEEIYIRYIRKVTETAYFNPAFCNILATILGAELAAKLADDTKKRALLLEEANKVLIPAAYHLNAIEGNRPKHKDEQPLDSGNFSWQLEGR